MLDFSSTRLGSVPSSEPSILFYTVCVARPGHRKQQVQQWTALLCGQLAERMIGGRAHCGARADRATDKRILEDRSKQLLNEHFRFPSPMGPCILHGVLSPGMLQVFFLQHFERLA